MTREKAIELLRELSNFLATPQETDEAFNMVIKALKQEPSEDCISREWLLNAFGLSEKTRKYGGDHSGYDTLMLYEIQDVIEDAPSVAPNRATGIWVKEINDYGEIEGWHCSNCYLATGFHTTQTSEFCPRCGAIMEGEEK